ncbi:MFS transporter [Chitiniphilus purpureus]|uniref:MFS transporter n=1 Tax=Chitiniphilus purpureus TaxID=2981137 RepID=A0ABY6DRY9_9NEIS|nr:MFS transporter [Chitiniphilus sp. CD1]UXY17145.1 MFS transporter [Chitiniphilus sp. CD1]
MTSSAGATVAAPVAVSARPLLTLLAMLALFLAAMDSTAMGTLLPFIKGQLGDEALYPWLMSGFILASVLATPLAGWMADIVGEKTAILGALLLFLLGSLAIWYAPSMQMLLWARVLQGAGAGAITVTTYVIIGRLYSAQERGKMQGILSLVWGLAAIAGPLAGALIHQLWGWRTVFLLNVPLCLVIAALIAAAYPRAAQAPTSPKRIDPLTLLAFAAFLTSALLLIMAGSLRLSEASRNGWSAVLAASLLIQAWRVYANKERSLVPVAFLSERRYLAPALATVLASITLYASVTLLPLYLNGSGHTDSVEGGLLVMAAALGWVVGSALCGGLTGKIGFRLPGVIGALLLLGGTGLLMTLTPAAANAMFALSQGLIGLGIGFIATTALVAVQNQAPLERIGGYTAAIQLCRNIGAALGINTMASLQIMSLRELEGGHVANAWSLSFDRSFEVLFAMTVLALLCALFMSSRPVRQN